VVQVVVLEVLQLKLVMVVIKEVAEEATLVHIKAEVADVK
jgi:hypothetical protein